MIKPSGKSFFKFSYLQAKTACSRHIHNKQADQSHLTEEELDEKNLGMAGQIANAFIHSPLSPLFFFLMLAIGIYGLFSTPRQEDPQISVPMIDIVFQHPGASPEEISALTIDPFERVLSEIPNLKHIYSMSDYDYGLITMEFEVGEPMGPSLVQVHSKISSNLKLLPPGVEPPSVKPKEVDDVPVVTLTLWSKVVDDEVLRTLAVDLLQHFKQLPMTGTGFVVGGRQRQIRVEVEPVRLEGFGISLGQIAMTLQGFNSSMTVGSIESHGRYNFVKSGGFLQSRSDVENLVVGQHQGAPIFIRDIAKVVEGPEETRSMVLHANGPAHPDQEMRSVSDAAAVTIALAKQPNTNGVEVVNNILAELEQLKGYKIPDNIHVTVSRDYGKTANDKVNGLLFKLLVATAAVTLLVWLSLGLTPSIVVLLTIPVILVTTVFIAMILGYTIDRVSLFALIFAIGILVDDAIVVVENIYRRWLRAGKMSTKIAVDAVREVGNPTILATYTVVAALVPMGFVRGMMGPYMEPIPVLGSVAMLLSLFSALIFVPWLSVRMRPPMEHLQKMEEREQRLDSSLDSFFHRALCSLMSSRLLSWGFFMLLIVSFALSMLMFYSKSVTVKMLPFDNKPTLSVVIDMPEGTALPETANLTRAMAQKLQSVPEVLSLQSYIGTAQPFDFNGLVRHYYMREMPWNADIAIQLLDKRERERSSHEIASEIRTLLTPLSLKSHATLTVVEMPPGPPVLQTLVAEIHGPDAETRRQVARDMTKLFRSSPLVTDVDNFIRAPSDYWNFKVDIQKAARQGVSVTTINQHLAMAMGMFKVIDLKQPGVQEPTWITLLVPLEKRAELSNLNNMPISTQDGRTIPLSELGHFERLPRQQMVFHKDLRAVEFVMGDTTGAYAAPIYAMFDIEDRLKQYKTPDGVTLQPHYTTAPANDRQSGFEWSGEWTVTFETFRDLGTAFIVALIAIYMLVVWQFGNFLIPAIIMAPIPLTLLGIIPGHWILGADFTATSMIGWIALAGIIVRNSILLVDFTIHQVHQGEELIEAVIMAVKARTRPILITALALVLGASVIITDPIFQGMAISLLFGVFVSTLLTLFVIPLGCVSLGQKIFMESKE